MRRRTDVAPRQVLLWQCADYQLAAEKLLDDWAARQPAPQSKRDIKLATFLVTRAELAKVEISVGSSRAFGSRIDAAGVQHLPPMPHFTERTCGATVSLLQRLRHHAPAGSLRLIEASAERPWPFEPADAEAFWSRRSPDQKRPPWSDFLTVVASHHAILKLMEGRGADAGGRNLMLQDMKAFLQILMRVIETSGQRKSADEARIWKQQVSVYGLLEKDNAASRYPGQRSNKLSGYLSLAVRKEPGGEVEVAWRGQPLRGSPKKVISDFAAVLGQSLRGTRAAGLRSKEPSGRITILLPRSWIAEGLNTKGGGEPIRQTLKVALVELDAVRSVLPDDRKGEAVVVLVTAWDFRPTGAEELQVALDRQISAEVAELFTFHRLQQDMDFHVRKGLKKAW